jgi:hypothetical protein
MTVLFALECVLRYSVGDILTVVPARDEGRGLSSGRTVVARDVCDAVGFAGMTVEEAFEPLVPEERREAWERDSLEDRALEELVRDLAREVSDSAIVIAVGAR